MKPELKSYSPWGQIDHIKELADGIIKCGTASHGGIWISDDRRQAMPPAIRDHKTFTGGNWYEEDCDWALVCVAFPDAFEPINCYFAPATIKYHHKLDAEKLAPACIERARGLTPQAAN